MIKKIKKLVIATMLWMPLLMAPSLMFAQNQFWGTSGVAWIGVPWTNQHQNDSFINTVKVAINRVLGMLSFVALVLCLYAGFKMLTSGWDSQKYDAWLSILKNAAIWLAIIALSWLIVSLIFRLINGSINGAGVEDVGTQELI